MARLLANATPDPQWTPGLADAIGGGTETFLAPVGDGLVWAVAMGETPAHTVFMQRLEASGPSSPDVVAGTPGFTNVFDMRVVPQPGDYTLVLHVAYFGATGNLLLDRVDPAGGVTQGTVSLPFSHDNFIEIGDAVDAGGGAVIASVQANSGLETYYDLYAVKLNADGTPAWPGTSRVISIARLEQEAPAGVSDGSGGAYFAWTDHRGTSLDVYAMHLLADGSVAPGWAANGRALAAVAGDQSEPHLAPDGAGGVWAVWTDSRSGVSNLYYTHIDAAGSVGSGFGTSGRPLSNESGSRAHPLAVPDGAGGFFAVWSDARSGTSLDLYGQHILSSGVSAPGLAPEGEPICTNAADQLEPALLDTGLRSAIVAWRDNRTGAAIVYATPMPAGGTGLGVPPRAPGGLALAPLGANPARGMAAWTISAPGQGPVTARLVDAAGRVRAMQTVAPQSGGAPVRFAMPEPGLYFLVASQAGNTRVSRIVAVR